MERVQGCETTKKRTSKTTRQQFSIYLEELEKNISFQRNTFEPSKPDVLKGTWDLLTTKLNSSGGPKRNMAQWKRIFCDWKSQVKKKARDYKAYQGGTGGGPPMKHITDLEEKLIELIGNVAVNGLIGVVELGVPESNPPHHGEIEKMKEREYIFGDSGDVTVSNKGNCNGNEHPSRNERSKRKISLQNSPRKKTFMSSIENLIEKCKVNEKYLQNIDGILKELIVIKKHQLAIEEMKLKIKYGIDIEYD